MSAVDLYRRHTIEELVEMADAIRRDPESRAEGGVELYTPRARQKLNEIGWAIYYHQRDGR